MIKFNYKEHDILEEMIFSGIFKALGKATEEGKPGMCMAQIFDNGDIKIGFIDHKTSLKLQMLMGGCDAVGKNIGLDGDVKQIFTPEIDSMLAEDCEPDKE